MKRINFALILLVLLVSCNNSSNKNASIYDYIPEAASIIVTINDTESLETNINNNDFISGISKSSVYKNVSKKLGLGAKIALPQIIVCGGTSVGKSTLLTAISRIEFPSAAGVN